MKDNGLDKDPAFDFLHFVDEPIPQHSNSRTILGLYYPDHARDYYGYIPPSTIHLPPDASTSTLWHELGHRHGHFYYNDMSEKYAEAFRKAHDQEAALRSEVCCACTEMATGRSKLCLYCEYGGHQPPAASMGPVASVFTNVVHFEDPPGTRLTTTQFNPGQALHIA